MTKKKKTTKRIRAPKVTKTVELSVAPFHITFPFTLFHKAEHKFCYFCDEFHMRKYIERYKLKPKDVTITQTTPR